MNKIHRTVWNELTRAFVAVAETVRGRGKRAGGSESASVVEVGAAQVPARRRIVRGALRPLALEQRIMFDGAAADTAIAALAERPVLDAMRAHPAHDAMAAAVPPAVTVREAAPDLNNERKEVVVIDTGVANYQTLVDSVRPGVGTLLINPTQDGLDQLAKALAGYSHIDALHIISHGEAGGIRLGTTNVTQETLAAQDAQWRANHSGNNVA